MEASLLLPGQKERLERFASGAFSRTLQRRARLLLLYNEGLTTREISREVGLSPGRVRYWRRRFRDMGMEVFPISARKKITSDLPGTGEKTVTPDEFLPQSESGERPVGAERQTHIAHVGKLALFLFDRLQSLHGLPGEKKTVLTSAIQFLDNKNLQGKRRSFATIKDFIGVHAQGLSSENQNDLAAVLTLGKRASRAPRLTPSGLSPGEQQEAAFLAAILTIARALDESNTQRTCIQAVEPGQGELWIIVSGPAAEKDSAAAQVQARTWQKVGFPRLRILTTDQADEERIVYPPFPERMERTGVQPEDTMAEAGRKVMRFHFAEMLSHEEGTRLGDDIEELHDMRVATRRLRAAFEVFGDAFDSKILKPHLKGLRLTGRALGHVRDLDVLMDQAREYLDELPEDRRSGLQPLLQAWQQQRESARAEMLDYLGTEKYQQFKMNFNLFLDTPSAGLRLLSPGQPTPNLVKEVAPILIYTRLAAVRAYDSTLSNASIQQLHALRIEFKKFRYLIEFFREVLGEEARSIIFELKMLQDHLGNLNDAEVATQLIRQFLDEWETQQMTLPIDQRNNPEAIVNYLASLHARRYRLTVTFRQVWDRFNRPEFRRTLAMAVSAL